jgi:hypothetical protein
MKILISFVSMLTLVAVFTAPVHAQMPTPPVGGNQPDSMVGRWHEVREHHPEIRRAMNKLEGAKNDLVHAARDYEGHRTKAVQDIDAAMSELQQALAVDIH